MTTTLHGGFSQDVANAVALQEDGKILLAGRTESSDFAVVRYRPGGSLDTSFGVGGLMRTDPCFCGGFDQATAIRVEADGRIVVGGSTFLAGSNSDFVVARYLSALSVVAIPALDRGGLALLTFTLLAVGLFLLRRAARASVARLGFDCRTPTAKRALVSAGSCRGNPNRRRTE